MQTFISIVIALIIFGVLVLIHEFGHFIVAKKNGVVVNEFSIGMGPRLLSHTAKSGTAYSLKLLPIGGSCAMLGEDEDNEEEGSFNSKSVWARMAIVFAGPFFNFILAFVLALIVIGYAGADVSYLTKVPSTSKAYEAGLREGDKITKFNGAAVSVGRELWLDQYVSPLNGSEIKVSYVRNGKSYKTSYKPDSTTGYKLGFGYTTGAGKAQINSVTKKSAMDKAGVKTGDVITAIDGTSIKTADELANYIKAHPFSDKEVTISIKSSNKTSDVKVAPKMTKTYDDGFDYNLAREKQSPLNVIKYSFVEMRYQISTVVKSLKLLVTGKVSAQEVSGPVGIVNMIGDTYSESKSYGAMVTLMTLINLAILLSANLGVMNLLPIPALDGGRILLYLVEVVTRKPIPKDKEGMIHFVGFILLMALMVFLVFNDIRKII